MSSINSSSSHILIPPRLLGGATLLFWGAMTGEMIVSLVVAILLEAKNWVKWSWDFDDTAYVKAFQVSLGLLGFVLFLVWMGEVDYHSLNVVMKWFPLCLLPVELAQRYGRSDHMKINTFFYFARQRMKQDIKEGKKVDPEIINTGYPYIFVLIVFSSCNNRMDILTQALMWLLLIWVIVSVSIQRGFGFKRLLWSLPLLIVTVVLIQVEAVEYYGTIKGKLKGNEHNVGDTTASATLLGKLGEVKQSKEIQWRMWGEDVPKYLLLNSYNFPLLGGWKYDFSIHLKNDGKPFEKIEEAFESGGGIEITRDKERLFIFDINHQDLIAVSKEKRRSVRIRGAGDSDSEESVVPSTSSFYAISEMHGEDAKPAVHPLGVLKLVERKAVIDYQLWFDGVDRLVDDPNEIDRELPRGEGGKDEDHKKIRDKLSQLSKEMRLSEYPKTEQKIEKIAQFFNRHFVYSLAPNKSKLDIHGSDLELFLSDVEGGRTGHCEYFATAAALLLREQGIPARYCIGYVAREKSGDTWNMRGTHAHAWCRAWVNGKWEIVDLTPPDWLDLEIAAQDKKWSRGITDWFQNIKQDFLMWRTDEANKDNMNKVIIGLIAILFGWITYRLYKARKVYHRENEDPSSVHYYDVSNDLIAIEGELNELIGERAETQTYYSWIISGRGKLDTKLFSVLKDLVSSHEESRFGGKDRVRQMAELAKKAKSLLIK